MNVHAAVHSPAPRTFGIGIGRGHVADMLNPRPEEIDFVCLESKLECILRFANDPKALNVRQHARMVHALARHHFGTGGYAALHPFAREDVLWWAKHHDDHEGIIGDIVSPVEALLATETDLIPRIKEAFDRAICQHHGKAYPSDLVRGIVHHFDKMAGGIEHRFLLNFGEPKPWHPDYSQVLTDQEAMILARECRSNHLHLSLLQRDATRTS